MDKVWYNVYRLEGILMNDDAAFSLVIIIDRDGMPFYMGKFTDLKLHVEYLNMFLKQNYDGFDDFDKSTPVNKVIDSLTGFGNVVFLNEKLFGAIFIPSDLNEKQVAAIYDLALEIGGKPVVLNQMANMDLGFPLYQVNDVDEGANLKEVMDKYLESKKERGHQR